VTKLVQIRGFQVNPNKIGRDELAISDLFPARTGAAVILASDFQYRAVHLWHEPLEVKQLVLVAHSQSTLK
jgi:hypothetical protein